MLIIQKIKKLYKASWNIGFIENTIDGIMNGDPLRMQMMKHHYDDRWFADPFILDVTEDCIFLLVEECLRKNEKSRISKLTVKRETYELMDIEPVLEPDYHISFPAILRKENKVYIYPETADVNSLQLFTYDQDKVSCAKKIENGRVVDCIITDRFDKVYMFTTTLPNSNGHELKIIPLDGSETINYLFDENIARSAGDFFTYKGQIFRPAQYTDVQYGHGISVQSVSMADGKFNIKEVLRLYSTDKIFKYGMHTLNQYHGIIVCDALSYKRHWMRAAVEYVYLKRVKKN